MNRSIARVRNVVVAFGLVVAGTVFAASPASAHHPVVTGHAVCNSVTGNYDVTWTIASDEDYNKLWQLTSISREIGISVPTPLQDDQEPFTGSESVPPGSGTLTLTVGAHWEKASGGDDVDQTNEGKVKIPYAPCTPPDECADLDGDQPPGFPCAKEPVHGQDPWQGQPDCDHRTVSSGYTPWTRTWTFVADPQGGTGSWVLGDKVYGPTVVTDTHDVTLEECPPPPAEPVTEAVSGCDLSAYGLEPGSWTRTGEREYVLDGTDWVLEDPADIAWGDWAGAAWTAEEIEANCSGDKPEPQVRTASDQDASCELGGVLAWSETFTTDWIFNTETQLWELGEESGPDRTEEFTPYTQAQLESKGCIEVAGNQGQVLTHQLPADVPDAPEVKGEQAVPSAVDAGLGPVGTPIDSHRNPLWLLVAGGGIGLLSSVGWRRRTTANR